jgi:hypothetical protein
LPLFLKHQEIEVSEASVRPDHDAVLVVPKGGNEGYTPGGDNIPSCPRRGGACHATQVTLFVHEHVAQRIRQRFSRYAGKYCHRGHLCDIKIKHIGIDTCS